MTICKHQHGFQVPAASKMSTQRTAHSTAQLLSQSDLSFADKPTAPEGPLEVTDVHAEGCKLKWNPPKDDGGQPLDGYVVEKMDTETGRWVPIGRPTKPEMEVNNLEPGKEYKFRVRAVNPEGESEPLETEKGTIAKNPYGNVHLFKRNDWSLKENRTLCKNSGTAGQVKAHLHAEQ